MTGIAIFLVFCVLAPLVLMAGMLPFLIIRNP